MTRLPAAFAKGNPALVCFVTPGEGDTAAILDALVAGGATDIFYVAEHLGVRQ